MEHILKPLFNLQNSGWHPSDGINGLKECLKQKGALFFMGKFGFRFYSTAPMQSINETTNKRFIYFFDNTKYTGDTIPFTHGIIVDQIKIVNGEEMVFYRDPNWPSITTKKEIIFMMPYEIFILRLTDTQGNRTTNFCSSYGLASKTPHQLYK